jgi:putative redox protein
MLKDTNMTTQSVDVKWASNMAFKANISGHELMLDLDESGGGQNLGPKPKPLLLVSLGGCTAMDVVLILKKMRIEPEYFNVKVEGELTEEHPKHFKKIKIIYEFRGENLPIEKLQKAIDLSQEHYCGVSETLRKSVEITSEIRIL